MRQPQYQQPGRFDSQFSGRSTHAQAVASNDASGSILGATGTGIKIGSALGILVGAITVGIEPISGISMLAKTAITFLAGNTMKAAGQTITETLENGAEGHQESGTQITQRFSTKFKQGLYKPW